MRPRDQHPCLDCPLPDCDESDRRCNLKRALSEYHRARRRGQITDIIRARNSIAYSELYGSDRNARRKAQREAGHA